MGVLQYPTGARRRSRESSGVRSTRACAPKTLETLKDVLALGARSRPTWATSKIWVKARSGEGRGDRGHSVEGMELNTHGLRSYIFLSIHSYHTTAAFENCSGFSSDGGRLDQRSTPKHTIPYLPYDILPIVLANQHHAPPSPA